MNSNKQNLINKIKYRSHYRGTKEMDILLSKFVDKYINSFSKDELEDLYNFLNLEDEIIYNFYQTKKIGSGIIINKVLELFGKFKI